MINSANYLSQMESLKSLKLGFQKYFTYLPQFLKFLFQNLKVDSFFLYVYEARLNDIEQCMQQLALSQAKSLSLTATLKEYETQLPLQLFDELKRCPNLVCLWVDIICQKDKPLISKLKNRIKKKCIRLVKTQYFFL
ncbi:hypothetical protein ABPG72_017899 [Tetrahymena utriculariae]